MCCVSSALVCLEEVAWYTANMHGGYVVGPRVLQIKAYYKVEGWRVGDNGVLHICTQYDVHAAAVAEMWH